MFDDSLFGFEYLIAGNTHLTFDLGPFQDLAQMSKIKTLLLPQFVMNLHQNFYRNLSRGLQILYTGINDLIYFQAVMGIKF